MASAPRPPHSTLEVAASPDGGFGSYLQLPVVHGTAAPPPGDCDGTTQAGRMVLQENNGTITLWICAPAAAGAGMSGQSSSPGRWVAK